MVISLAFLGDGDSRDLNLGAAMTGLEGLEGLPRFKRLMASERILLAVRPLVMVNELPHVTLGIRAHEELAVAERARGGLVLGVAVFGVFVCHIRIVSENLDLSRIIFLTLVRKCNLNDDK